MSVVEIGSILSALLVIIGTCWKTFSMCHNLLNKMESMEQASLRNERHIMKLALFNEGLPLVDRIQCGKRYLELGGNGTGKIQYELLVRRMEDQIEHKGDDTFARKGDY